MAENDKVEIKLVPANVEHKTWAKKQNGQPTGETGQLWKVTMVGGTHESSTFSETCAKALETRLGTELMFSLTGDRPFQNRDQWKIDKVVDPATGEVVYVPEAKGGGGKGGWKGGGNSRPDWSYETEQERMETRLSIEAQKALDLAVQTLAAIVVYDDTVCNAQGAIDFVGNAQRAYANLLRESVAQKSGSGSRPLGAGGQSRKGSKGSDGEGQAAPDARKPSVAAVPPAAPSRPEDGLPTPEPDSSSTETMATIEKLLVEIDALTGSRAKTLLAYKRVMNGKVPDPASMSSQELAIVKSDLAAVSAGA